MSRPETTSFASSKDLSREATESEIERVGTPADAARHATVTTGPHSWGI